VIPQPDIGSLRRSISVLHRHLREPPRKRRYQKMLRLS
jgi:hypothetical protein